MKFITEDMIMTAVKRLEGKHEFCTSDVLDVIAKTNPTEFTNELEAFEKSRGSVAAAITIVLKRKAQQGKMEQISQSLCDQSLYPNARWRTPVPGFDIVR
ncbi:MAG: hypothetical protein IPK53_19345 [bacterium]|nr:hypothetical protein [bacterium]MBK8130971.1 hypothetical protein [bacterium]